MKSMFNEATFQEIFLPYLMEICGPGRKQYNLWI